MQYVQEVQINPKIVMFGAIDKDKKRQGAWIEYCIQEESQAVDFCIYHDGNLLKRYRYDDTGKLVECSGFLIPRATFQKYPKDQKTYEIRYIKVETGSPYFPLPDASGKGVPLIMFGPMGYESLGRFGDCPTDRNGPWIHFHGDPVRFVDFCVFRGSANINHFRYRDGELYNVWKSPDAFPAKDL